MVDFELGLIEMAALDVRSKIELLRDRFDTLKKYHQSLDVESSPLDQIVNELLRESNRIFSEIDENSQLDTDQLIEHHDRLVDEYIQFKTNVTRLDVDSIDKWRVLNKYGLTGEEPGYYEESGK